MRRTLTCNVLLIAASVVAGAQAIKVQPHTGATDLWGSYYGSGHKITFSGRVTGIEIVRPSEGVSKEVTLLVRNSDGGGTSIVDLGPAWYVDNQVAKIRIKDKVQVIGSKVLVDGHGIVLASQIRVNGQGGLVVSLRRHSGRAYWMGTETAQNAAPPDSANVRSGRISNLSTYSINNVPYGEAILQTDNGLVNIDLGPEWYYGQQNVSYQIGDRVQVVLGPNPITVGPNLNVFPSYSIYQGSSIYTIRNADGSPAYYWGGNN